MNTTNEDFTCQTLERVSKKFKHRQTNLDHIQEIFFSKLK